MRLAKKLCTSLLLVLALLIVGVYIWECRNYNGVVYHSHQKYGKVEISRDQYAIPHIKAKNVYGASFGQGYAHAQDRLFQIFLKTKLGRGEISSLKGEAGLPYDIFFRTLGLQRIAEDIVAKLEKEELEVIQAYCDGFNFYYHSLSVKPLEFVISGVTFQDFTPVDAIINERIMFLLLGYEYIWEPIRTNLANQFTEDIAIKMFAGSSESQFVEVTVVDDEDLKQENLYQKYIKGKTFSKRANFTEQQKQAYLSTSIQDVLFELLSVPNGSNAWVIHGNHTKSGKPLLANDPHLSNTIPCTWVQNEMLIEDEGIVAIGSSISGIPLIQNGRTDYAAWGTTVLFADTSDLYKEDIKDNTYLVDGQWKELKIIKESIKIKGKSEPHILEVKYTHRGPLVSYKFDKFATNPLIDLGFSASLCWNGEIRKSTLVSSVLKLYRAKNHQQVLEGFGHIVGPVLSVVYATADGNIGFYGYGRIPVHKNTIHSQFIKDGTTTEQDWVRFTQPSEQPQVHNPRKGFVVTANNKFATDNLKGYLSANLISTPRAYRITQMIEEKIKKGLKFDIEDMKRMQADTVDSYGQDILPYLFKIFNSKAQTVLSQQEYEKALRMINHLKDWDCRIDANSYQATIFLGWEYIFSKSLLHSFNTTEFDRYTLTMGPQFEHFYFNQIKKWSQQVNEKDFDQFWCKTEENKNQKYSCLYNLLIAFAQVEDYMTNEFGTSDVKEWEWGIIHKNNYPHTAFAKIPILKDIYNRQVDSFGNRRTVAVSIQNWRGGTFESAYGANYRMVVDMDKQGKDYWIVDTGISESVFSPHYDDQFKIHKDFGYVNMERGFSYFRQNKKYYQTLEYLAPQTQNSNKQNNSEL
ncbi:hypothetical protein ABPG74_018139 [Tetrahymena malaccensis]